MIYQKTLRFSQYFLLFMICLVGLLTSALGQKRFAPEKPKLIIGLVIDQMSRDDMFRYWDKYGDNGFKRLVNEGAFYKNACYDYISTGAAPGLATIVTGSNPAVNGIVADSWYDRSTGQIIKAVDEGSYSINGTQADLKSYNPANLVTGTMSDELKYSGTGKSKIISISLFPQAAVLDGGHSADASYWFDFKSGNWVTGSYYMKELPSWVNDFNAKKIPSIYMEKEWKSLLPLSYYTECTAGDPPQSKDSPGYFSYSLSKPGEKNLSYPDLAGTPFGDNLVKDFALEAIASESLGKDASPDILFVDLASVSIIAKKYGENSVEKEDAYLRLDQDIAHFLQFLDDQVGRENLVLFLTSSGASHVSEHVLSANKIPVNTFDADKAMILLKAYLNAAYRPGDWIKKYYDRQIYLNKTLIEDSKIKYEDFEKEVSGFMSQFSGIAAAVPSQAIYDGRNGTPGLARVQENYYAKRCGDVFLIFEPGTKEINGQPEENAYITNGVVPLIWYGWKLNRFTIGSKVSMTRIAPTVADFLNINPPAGCETEALEELIR